MKSKVDELDIDNLVPVPVNLSKINDVVKIMLFKKDVYNVKTVIADKIRHITNLAITTARK